MPISSSSPVKPGSIPSSGDSGINIRLEEIATNVSDSEMEKLSPGASEKDFTIEMDDDHSEGSDQTSSIIDAVNNQCGSTLKKVVLAVACILYAVYFVWCLMIAAMHDCDDKHNIVPLVVLTIVGLLFVTVSFVKKRFEEELNELVMIPLGKSVDNHWHWLKWVLIITPMVGIVAIIIGSAIQKPSNLMSLVGWLFFLCLLLICSRAPRQVNWRPVIGGFALQFYFATLILKSDTGYIMFNGIGKGFTTFLDYSNTGSKFVFGEQFHMHFFAFKVLPVIIFFSCVISMLYHLGIMQAVIGKIAFVMRVTLGTTAAESMCAAGNIFVGQTEAPILIRPFLAIMTRSELHAVMVGGFGTIAGAVLAAFIMKGVPAIHLLTACLMNAPAALAVSKLLYPELGHSKIAKMREAIEQKSQYKNVIEAAAAGASSSISLVANVAANLIAFVSLLSFANSAISWFGSFICYDELSFEVICSYLFMPLAFIMGVEWTDAGNVAELLGMKTFINEFVAYDKLAEFMTNRKDCLEGIVMSVRSETIATYALCGFANLSSIGIQLGGLGPMAPNRLGDLAQLAGTALLGGIVTNLMTACIAGLLVIEAPFDMTAHCLNTSSVLNTSVAATVLSGTSDLYITSGLTLNGTALNI